MMILLVLLYIVPTLIEIRDVPNLLISVCVCVFKTQVRSLSDSKLQLYPLFSFQYDLSVHHDDTCWRD